MRRLALVAVAVFLAPSAAPAADDAAADLWYAHFHGDVKAGWDRTRRTRSTLDGKTVWISETESRIIRFMDGSLLKTPMTSTSRYVEDESGAVISYATFVDPGTGPQRHEGTVKDGVVSAVDDGKPRTVPYPAGALGPAAIDRAIVADLKAGAAGQVVEFDALDPTRSGALKWTVSGMTTTLNVMGRYIWSPRVEKIDTTGIPDVVQFGPGGVEYAGATDMGMHHWYLTEECVAKADALPASLLTSRIVAPDRALDMKERPLAAKFRLSRKGGAVGDVPVGGGQRIVARNKDGSVDVEVRVEAPPPGAKNRERPYKGAADMARFLAATPLVELAHPRLPKFAEQTVHCMTGALQCARAIELGVHDYLTPAPADVGFATACEAISGATGDSTEAAVLAVGYARALGLPARLVAGFVYWEASTWPADSRPQGAFAFHTWAEVLVADEQWLPIDPARMRPLPPEPGVVFLEGNPGFDATHVAVLRSDLATSRPITDIVMPVLAFLDGLSIEVLPAR